MSGDFRPRRLAGTDAGHECRVGLEFAVDAKAGCHFARQLGRFYHLVHHFVLGGSFGGEAQHGHFGIQSGHGFGRAGRAYGDLCQLACVGHRSHGHVAHDQHTVFPVVRGFGEQEHGPRHAGDARGGLDDLQGRAQDVARRVACAGQLPVGIPGFNHEAPEEERVQHFFLGFFHRHAFFLAELEKQLCVFFFLGAGGRIDDGSLGDVAQSPFFCGFFDFRRVTQDNQVGHFVRQDAVGGFQCAFFRAFGKDDALLVGLCAGDNLIE